jgi:NTE family protein
MTSTILKKALVLGAGGHAATAWEIGMIAGLADAGVDVRHADLLVGTSAGARLSAELASDRTTEQLFRAELAKTSESKPNVDMQAWRESLVRIKNGSGLRDTLKRFGELGAEVSGDATAERDELAHTLHVQEWPVRDVAIAAVDAESGERHAFRRDQGVPFLDAIAASCAVPGIRPLVPIAGHLYMDGGTYSLDNADLAAGCDRVLVLTLRAGVPALSSVSLDDGMKKLAMSGALAESFLPDSATEKAFASVHGNVMDPAVREVAARAGRAQGRAVAHDVAAFWA